MVPSEVLHDASGRERRDGAVTESLPAACPALGDAGRVYRQRETMVRVENDGPSIEGRVPGVAWKLSAKV